MTPSSQTSESPAIPGRFSPLGGESFVAQVESVFGPKLYKRNHGPRQEMLGSHDSCELGYVSLELREYRAFVKRGMGIDVWEDLRTGTLLGTDSFVASLKPLLRDVVGNREIRREERLATRPALEELFANVTDKPTRNKRIHVAVRKHEYKLKEIGDFLSLCYSTISVIAKRVNEEKNP